MISFQTDLPLRSTPVGVAKIEVTRLTTNFQTRKVERTKLLSVNGVQLSL
ncbi:MAG: hypothetical protein KME21_30895 [Desmonostoc vinosum HA7617-LM4]|nr:hypothetical protein [Desmonostoc vinosum HA7617-LM4]